MQVETNGRSGALTVVRVTGSADELAAAREAVPGRFFDADDGAISGRISKGDLARLRSLERAAPASATANHTAPARQSRRLMLLSTAERLGLRHGRSWVGSARDADLGDPSFEGELVCYVYED